MIIINTAESCKEREDKSIEIAPICLATAPRAIKTYHRQRPHNMIVVFVVDTSPSMAKPSITNATTTSNSTTATNNNGTTLSSAKGISRLDVAKMSIESLARSMDKRIMEHNRSVLVALSSQNNKMMQDVVGRLENFDDFLLLSTSLQPDALQESSPSVESIVAAAESHAACGAGGRLLVGSVDSLEDNGGSVPSSLMDGNNPNGVMLPHPPDRHDFERELKRLGAATVPKTNRDNQQQNKTPFPEWAGGATGLNAALSHGLGLLSRYRLTRGRFVEHFGMGRLPWFEHQMTKLTKSKAALEDASKAGGRNESPLQPACLVLLTDGECLRLPPQLGGGQLKMQFGKMPLREFYREREYQ